MLFCRTSPRKPLPPAHPPPWVLTILQTLNYERHVIMSALSDITDQVHANTSAFASLSHVIDNMAALIVSQKDNPAALEALAAELKATNDAMTAKVLANTAADPSATPVAPPASPAPPVAPVDPVPVAPVPVASAPAPDASAPTAAPAA